MVTMRRKLGDVYKIVFEGAGVGLLHYVNGDSTIPGSQVVNVISPIPVDWEITSDAEFSLLPVLFSAHVFLRAGETLSIWGRAGHKAVLKKSLQKWCTVPPQELGKESSRLWRVWVTNEPMKSAASDADIKNAEFGFIASPSQIVHRIRHGTYTLLMPKSVG